ncbi:MAG: SMC-Scp complex subunit ScpB [Hydrogeniiclostridium sp.]
MDIMDKQILKGMVEAILFASGDPVSGERIAQVLGLDKEDAEEVLKDTMESFNRKEGGVRIIRLDDTYQMCSNPAYASCVREALELRRNTPLSQAAMEVLAVIAYNQPVTKAFVEQIRGVDCSGVIGSLSSKGLIEERGRLELPGRPLLYGTTPDFLRCLNISSLEELPPLPERQREGDTSLEEEDDSGTEEMVETDASL